MLKVWVHSVHICKYIFLILGVCVVKPEMLWMHLIYSNALSDPGYEQHDIFKFLKKIYTFNRHKTRVSSGHEMHVV